MDEETCDLAVIGAGPGGMAAALHAASRGLEVVLVNGGGLLGCGLQGAYKSKGLWELAKDCVVAHKAGRGYAPAGPGLRFDEIHAQLESGVRELTGMYRRYLDAAGIRTIDGWGRFVDPHVVAVGDRRIRARWIILAAGTRPRVPPGIAADGTRILTSDHVVDIDRPFGSLLVVGAGVIGCEFASIFSAFGVKVTLLDRADRLLGQEDADLSDHIAAVYRRNDIDVRFGASLASLRADGEGILAVLAGGAEVRADRALIATGRVACTDGLNPGAAGVVAAPDGFIEVDDHLRTNVPHVYAIGDMGRRKPPLDLALAHVAEAEGRWAVKHILGEPSTFQPDYVPFIIFTLPMIAGAGLTERQARERHGEVRVAKFLNARNHRYHAMRSFEGFVKLIVGPPGDDRILGVRAVGPQADNVIGEAAVLIDNKIPYTYLLDAVHAHPSLAESLQNGARMIAGTLPATF